MALVFVDSCEHYTIPILKYPALTATGVSINATGGARGGPCLSGANNQNATGASVDIPTSHATWTAGTRHLLNTDPLGTRYIFRFWEGGTPHLELHVTANGALRVARNGTQLGITADGLIVANTWHYIEFKATCHDTTGSFEVRVDGITVLSASGVDTRNGGTGVFSRFQVQGEVGGTGGQNQHDIYLCDGSGSVNTTFLGDIRVATLLPTGAGNSTQWTPSTGSNFQNVDDAAPDDDTTYNESTTPGNIDTFAMGDLPSTAVSIFGVQQLSYVRKTDAGARTLRQVLRRSGTDYEGPDKAVSDTFLYVRDIRETDPSTSVAWTEAGINALEAGYKDQA